MRIQILGVAVAGSSCTAIPLLIAILVFLFLLGLFSGPAVGSLQLLLPRSIPSPGAEKAAGPAQRHRRGPSPRAWPGSLARYLIQPNGSANGYEPLLLASC